MPLTISYREGDGVNDDLIAMNIQLPDTNGGNANVGGVIQAAGASADTVNATLALPAAPVSGSIYFNIQVDPYVAGGNPSVQQSITTSPAALASGDSNPAHLQRIVYSQTLTSTTIDPALDAGSTPDPSLGSP